MAENKDKVQSELNNQAVAQSVDSTNSTTVKEETKFRLEVYGGITLIPDLVITREAFVSKGKTLWKYCVTGKFMDKQVVMELDAGTFYISGKRYTDTDIFALLNDVFETFPTVCFGVKSYVDNNKRISDFYVVGKSGTGVYSAVPVSFGGRLSSLSKLSMLLSDISIRYGVTLPILF